MRDANKIRVLVVDDSAFMRKAISIMIADDPEIEVVGTAHNGEEGLQKVHELSPDLVTMDIEMPRMDGLTALRKIMLEKPTPVMMVSSLTTEGAEATLEALDLGAVDFIPKQLSYVSLDIVKIKQDLIAKIKHISRRKYLVTAQARNRRAAASLAGSKPRPGPRPVVAPIPAMPSARRTGTKAMRVVAIGTSTGGPPALQQVVPVLPKEFPVPILIVQHIPAMFTKTLAQRLNTLSALQVKEAEEGDRLDAGIVFIAPGDRHMLIRQQGANRYIHLSHEPAESLYKPSVDVMMTSVAESFRGCTLGVIMTGMGHDGLEAIRKIKKEGGLVIAQDEATCIVYGMPRAIVEAGLADKVSSIERIATDIVSYF